MALITYLTRIQFDFGALKLLESELQLLGIRRPLIVTDKGVIAAGLWARVKEQLPGNMPLTMYDGTPENPTEAAMRDALRIYKEEGCDGIIAIGGGSPMDLAKAVGLMATHPGKSLQAYSFVEGGAPKITSAVAPIVAIPTTAGTGSEVSRGGVIIMDSGRKLAIGSPYLIPKLALIDPELTMGLPPHLTAGTGMDAFIHCLEAYCAPGYHPYAEGIAVEGMRLVRENLARAVKDGRDIEARGHMLAASQMGSTAFQKGLGAIHSLSHPVGATLDTHHGLTNAVAMPYVLKFNRLAIDDKIQRLSRWLGLRNPTFDGFMDWSLELRRQIGIPHTLAELGVKESHLDKFAEMAAVDPTAGGNPVKAGVPEMRKMYDAALAGRL